MAGGMLATASAPAATAPSSPAEETKTAETEPPPATPRKIVYNAQVTLVVENLSGFDEKFSKLIKESDGYVSQTDQSTQAESQRHAFLDICETKTGDVARRACESALLPGAADEVAVFKRRGLLLQADNQLSPALDAYMAAAHLDPGDRSVALAIVSLSGSTGRQDALTLAARGRALMTLGRASEALEPLRRTRRRGQQRRLAKGNLM